MELSEGYAVGPYRLVERAGAGGMAEVWRAYDARLKRYVAIKFLSPRYAADDLYLERFRHEAQAISRLDHPNILTVYDYGEQDGWTYMVSPYVGGGTLAAQLRRGAWTVEEAVAVLEPLASALDYAHAEGIVHRDVKPSNVLFTERGRLLLSDFGIARMIEGTPLLSQAGLIVGTPMYMSPEQADGQRVAGASDRYSLGVIAYEMLTGRPPFMAETPLALLRAHIDKPLPPPRTVNPGLPEPIEAALFTIMAKDPDHRFRSSAAFVAALRSSAARSVPVPAPEPPDPLRDPTLPLDGSDVYRPDVEPVSEDVESERDGGRTTPLPPPPTRLLDPTLPTVGVELRGTAARWIVPLAPMVVAWVIAWALLQLMRSWEYEPIYRMARSWPPSDASPWLSSRCFVAALAGLIGGAGIVVGVREAAWRIDRRSVLLLIGGWALSYGVVQVAFYLAARAFGVATAEALDRELIFFAFSGTPIPLLAPVRLVDVLPAALGAGLLVSVLRPAPPGAAAWIVIGWLLAALLSVLGTMALEANIAVFGDLLYGPGRFGLAAGLLAGIIHGIVGGGLTLWALHRRR